MLLRSDFAKPAGYNDMSQTAAYHHA